MRAAFFDLKETKEGQPYLTITESRFKGEGKDRERASILVFPDHARRHLQTFLILLKPGIAGHPKELAQGQQLHFFALVHHLHYCRNQACDKGSFTNLLPGLVPYSRYRTKVKLRAVQMSGWGYRTYHRTGQALGVRSMTVYLGPEARTGRPVSAWGYELLPVAALFGVVRYGGAVGVDEKYVLVPKACGERSRTNDKPGRCGVGRFDQHYQNFCGFQSIETAQVYLGVFEKLYRLTPFSEDAQPRIRGKCPLELAGYDLSRLPAVTLWNGLSIEWPMEAPHGIVPNR